MSNKVEKVLAASQILDRAIEEIDDELGTPLTVATIAASLVEIFMGSGANKDGLLQTVGMVWDEIEEAVEIEKGKLWTQKNSSKYLN
jgi:hypothetical protein